MEVNQASRHNTAGGVDNGCRIWGRCDVDDPIVDDANIFGACPGGVDDGATSNDQGSHTAVPTLASA